MFAGDPQVVWLNIINLALGVVAAVCLVLVVGAVAREIIARRRSSEATAPVDAHTFAVPGLGTTMADGGEPVERDTDA